MGEFLTRWQNFVGVIHLHDIGLYRPQPPAGDIPMRLAAQIGYITAAARLPARSESTNSKLLYAIHWSVCQPNGYSNTQTACVDSISMRIGIRNNCANRIWISLGNTLLFNHFLEAEIII